MQINEELIKQITNAVLSQMSQAGNSSASPVKQAAPVSEVPSFAGKERINEVRTSYADFPRAK